MIKKLKIIFCIILILCLIIPKLIGVVSYTDKGDNYENSFVEVDDIPTFFTDIKNFYISEDESLLMVDYERWGVNYLSVTDKGTQYYFKYDVSDFADFGKDEEENNLIIFAKDYLIFNYSQGVITYIENENNTYANLTDYYDFSFDQYTENGCAYILNRGVFVDTLAVEAEKGATIIDRTYKFDFIVECMAIIAIVYIIANQVLKKKKATTDKN
ncbi:MAG: hypothetical protein R3Y32_03845 [Bacillota bacterium]